MTAKKQFKALCEMAGLDYKKALKKTAVSSRGKHFSHILRMLIQIGNYSFKDLDFLNISETMYYIYKGEKTRAYLRSDGKSKPKTNPIEYTAFLKLYEKEIETIFKA